MEESKHIAIAIDGPAAAGKSTVAKKGSRDFFILLTLIPGRCTELYRCRHL
jgi:cytidylate kinase